ncbi:MAG TPA: ABC transporter ATP-binding protein [Candidatus Limnocylindria bacterium]|nr:ABC transporter ATP-binding protein [Candidatus Limnocylindria bacterium]
MILEASDLVVLRGERRVAHATRIDLAEGEHLAFLGPNGAGKSSLVLGLATLLRTRGGLRYRGAPIGDPEGYRRRIAVVFQRALLLDRSVRDNAALGLALRGVGKREREARAEQELARLGVGQLADRSAIGLSGGEAQRVSIARALAIDPEILFLDEPFTALDAPTRETLIADLARVLRERGVTTVMVTHDRDEALSLADRVGIVMNGELRQLDTAEAVFGMPGDPEIAAFVGVENVIPARVERATDELTFLRIADQRVEITEAPPAGDAFPLLCIRPDDVVIARGAASTSARNSYAARIVRIEPIGRRTRLVLDCGFPLIAHVTRQSAREMALAVEDQVVASFKATVPHLLPRIRH